MIEEQLKATGTLIVEVVGADGKLKERRELKENALLELLPQAFPKSKHVMVMIDKANELVFIDTTSQGTADDVVTLLVRAGLELALVQTASAPAHFMVECLLDDLDDYSDFILGRECELKSTGEDAAMVTFKNHYLQTDEVRKHITEGKLPTKLAMTWDDRVSFVLTEGLQIKNITLLDAVMDGNSKDDSCFDTDVTIATVELSRLIPDLIEAMGGGFTWGSALIRW